MPSEFTFEEASQAAPKTFTFEQASAPTSTSTFSFEEATQAEPSVVKGMTQAEFDAAVRRSKMESGISPTGDIRGQRDTGLTESLFLEFPKAVGTAFDVAGRVLYEGGVNAIANTLAEFQPPSTEGAATYSTEQAIKSLPAVPRAAVGGVRGLVQSAPQMATFMIDPVLGVAAFGMTPEGFDAKQAAIAAVLPTVGKWTGAVAENIALRLGVPNETALLALNKIGGATGAAGLIAADEWNRIRQLPPEQQHDAIIEAAGNVGSMFMLGTMGEAKRSGLVEATEPLRTGALEMLAPNTAAVLRSSLPPRPPAEVSPELQRTQELVDRALVEAQQRVVVPGQTSAIDLLKAQKVEITPQTIALAERVTGGGEAPYGKVSYQRGAEAPTTEGYQNASSQQSATPPYGSVRTRSELGELPEGNVPAANAPLRVNEGEGTSTAQTEAALQEAQGVVQPANVPPRPVELPPNAQPTEAVSAAEPIKTTTPPPPVISPQESGVKTRETAETEGATSQGVQNKIEGGQGPLLAFEIAKTAKQSVSELKSRISNVKYGDVSKNEIKFDIDGEPHTAILKGRNRDLILGSSPEADAAIAARTILDGDSTWNPKPRPKGGVPIEEAQKEGLRVLAPEAPVTAAQPAQAPPAVKPAPAQAETKQPWEMTQDEYVAFIRGETPRPIQNGDIVVATARGVPYRARVERVNADGTLVINARVFEPTAMARITKKASDVTVERPSNIPTKIVFGDDVSIDRKGHEVLVKRALAEGKPVPPEVLADYPDLKPPAPSPAEAKGKEGPVKFEGTSYSRYSNALVSQDPATGKWRLTWFNEFSGTGELTPFGHKDYASRKAALAAAKRLNYKPVEQPPTPPISQGPGAKPTGIDAAIKNIEDLQRRIRGTGENLGMNVPKALLDTALEVARLTLKAGKTIAEAVDAAIEHIRKNASFQVKRDLNEAEIRQRLTDSISNPSPEAPVASTPPPPVPVKSVSAATAKKMEGMVKLSDDASKIKEQLDIFDKNIGDALTSGGRFLPKPMRPEVAKGAPAEPGTATSKAINQHFVNELVTIRRAMRKLETELQNKADPVSADFFTSVRKRFESSFRKVQELRRASHEALYFWNEIRGEYQEIARMAGELPEIKARKPILDQLVKDLRDREFARAGKDFVDYLRVNLFTPFSFTLDFTTNLLATAGHVPAWLAMDAAHLVTGRPITRTLSALTALRLAGKNAIPFSERLRLPEQIEVGLGTAAGGEFQGLPKEVMVDFSEILKGHPELADKLKNADYILGGPVRMKRAVDNFFGRFGATAELYNAAYQAGRGQGLKGESLKKFVDDFVKSPPEEAIKEAVRVGGELKFNRELPNWAERFASNTITKLAVEAYPRWALQFTKWAGEMLGVDPAFYRRVASGKVTPERVAEYLAKAATGWGAIYAFNQLFYDQVDPNTMEFVTEKGERIRLSGRQPFPEAYFLTALFRGDIENAKAALPYTSIPFAAMLGGQGGLLSPLVNVMTESWSGKYTADQASRELTKIVNNAIPGKSMLGLIRSLYDPTIREGVGAPLPGVSAMLPTKVNPTTGEPAAPKQRVPGTSIGLPTVGGTPFPGAVRVMNEVEQVLANHGITTVRPRGPSLIELPAEDVPKDLRREYEQRVGQNVWRIVSEGIRREDFKALPFDARRAVLNGWLSTARTISRAELAQKYGRSMTATKEEPMNVRRLPESVKQMRP